ncbi:MAG: SAM-dependent methyltransferase [Crocinitomicaceae bacterium]|nr:SAM-dependent methyltransferase [Crocinitomicaceae bacterium]
MSDTIFRKDGTAQGVAKQRLIESLAKPDKRVIFDPLAKNFVLGSAIMKLMGHKLNVWLSKKLAPGFHEHLIARTRFIDDFIEQSSDEGIEQYVILGAGYDLRGHRLKLSPKLKIFEVDQVEVQDRKRSKLPMNSPNSENITYVSVDFNQQSLSEQLLKAGFDKNKTTVFTLEGVTQYISKEAVISTLGELSTLTQNANITLYLSYVDVLFNENPTACFGAGYLNTEKIANRIKNMSAKVGEPWISFYSAQEVSNMLVNCGFSITTNKTLEDLNQLYFSPVGRALAEEHIFNLEHSVIAKKVVI